ncbi:MAG: hypothetical protein ACRDFW_05450 [bacterium]
MDRNVQWALVILLAVTLAYAAHITRYYYLERFAGTSRIDRWTGVRQEFECVRWSKERVPAPSTPSPFTRPFPRPPGSDARACEEHGWR